MFTSRLRVQLEFKIYGLGLRAQGLGQGSGIRLLSLIGSRGLGFTAQGLGLGM